MEGVRGLFEVWLEACYRGSIVLQGWYDLLTVLYTYCTLYLQYIIPTVHFTYGTL